MRPNIVQTWKTPPVPYLLITANAIVLQQVSVGDIQILKLFPNTLSADCKYSLRDTDNLTQWNQMQLSQQEIKPFSRFFSSFFKSSLNLEHFQKKDDPHSWCISEIRDSKKHGQINA